MASSQSAWWDAYNISRVERDLIRAEFMDTNSTTKASPWAVEAYKTYLFRKGKTSVKQIESIKAGQAIDLKELEAEIAAVEKTILMCEKINLPTYEEANKLKGLKGLRDQLNGCTWPSLKDIETDVKLAKLTADETKAKLLALAQAKAQLQAQKLTNKWVAPDPVKTPGSSTTYSYKPAWSKPQTWTKPQITPVKVGAALGNKLNIDQEWIMRVGFESNLNVTIMQTGQSWDARIELSCKVCSVSKYVENYDVVSTNTLTDGVQKFCREHRHDITAPAQREGRFFRDED